MSGEKEKKRHCSKKCIGRRQKSHKPQLTTQTIQEANQAEIQYALYTTSCLQLMLIRSLFYRLVLKWFKNNCWHNVYHKDGILSVLKLCDNQWTCVCHEWLLQSSWKVFIINHAIGQDNEVLKPFPNTIAIDNLMPLINKLHTAKICTGNYEARFAQLAQIR